MKGKYLEKQKEGGRKRREVSQETCHVHRETGQSDATIKDRTT